MKQSVTSETKRSFSRDTGITRAAIERKFGPGSVRTARVPEGAQFDKHLIDAV
jgi:hypothetical protein